MPDPYDLLAMEESEGGAPVVPPVVVAAVIEWAVKNQLSPEEALDRYCEDLRIFLTAGQRKLYLEAVKLAMPIKKGKQAAA